MKLSGARLIPFLDRLEKNSISMYNRGPEISIYKSKKHFFALNISPYPDSTSLAEIVRKKMQALVQKYKKLT